MCFNIIEWKQHFTGNVISKIISVTNMQTVTTKAQLAWSECIISFYVNINM